MKREDLETQEILLESQYPGKGHNLGRRIRTNPYTGEVVGSTLILCLDPPQNQKLIEKWADFLKNLPEKTKARYRNTQVNPGYYGQVRISRGPGEEPEWIDPPATPIEDISYYRDRLIRAMGVPKEYLEDPDEET